MTEELDHLIKNRPIRRSVFRAALESGEPFSIAQLAAKCLKMHPPVSRASVYRNLRLLLKHGYLRENILRSGLRVYQPAADSRNMVWVCDDCSRIQCLAGEDVLDQLKCLTNLASNRWDTDAVEGLIQADEKTQQTFVDALIKALQDIGASGVLIDWQGIDPALSAELVEFLGRMHLRLEAESLELWLSIAVGEDLRTFDLEDLPGVVDHLVAQLHDENAETDAPGPIASQPWFEGWLRTLMGYGQPSQWILSLGAYGYDWNTTRKKTATISFADSMARAQRSGGGPVTSSAPDSEEFFWAFMIVTSSLTLLRSIALRSLRSVENRLFPPGILRLHSAS